MAHLKRKNGHLLQRNGHLSICCCYICGCTVATKTSYTVDFGAGGWVDQLCDYCDQVAGAFVIGGLDPNTCCAVYSDTLVCTAPGYCEPNPNIGFAITLCLVDAGGGQLKWTVFVEIRFNVYQNPACSQAYAEALFESAAFDPDQCDVVPVTLNKVSETLASTDIIPLTQMCTGALPATITLDET